MKKYAIEKTFTAINNSYMYQKGHKESYICRGNHVVLAKAFFETPTLWSEYFYASKKRAERSMEIIQRKNTQGKYWPVLRKYWDVSFRIVEIEAN